MDDDKSDNLDNRSIYSADISLEDYDSNNSNNSSIYSADISLEGCNLNEDIINDTNRSMDFGKIF